MDKLFFMERIIRSISDGNFFRSIFAMTLKCFAVLLADCRLANGITWFSNSDTWRSDLSGYLCNHH